MDIVERISIHTYMHLYVATYNANKKKHQTTTSSKTVNQLQNISQHNAWTLTSILIMAKKLVLPISVNIVNSLKVVVFKL